MDPAKNAPILKWIWILLRITLGGIFLYASFEKIMDPERFAYAISNYRILPPSFVNGVALLLPWFEAVIGLFLILGLFEWVSLSLFNGLMVIFMAVITLSLIRGLNITCGCFTSDPNADKMSWVTLLRDSAVMIPGLAAYPLLLRLNRPPFCKKR